MSNTTTQPTASPQRPRRLVLEAAFVAATLLAGSVITATAVLSGSLVTAFLTVLVGVHVAWAVVSVATRRGPLTVAREVARSWHRGVFNLVRLTLRRDLVASPYGGEAANEPVATAAPAIVLGDLRIPRVERQARRKKKR